MDHITYSLESRSAWNQAIKTFAQITLASLTIGLAGKIALPLFFTPVPLVLQAQLILLTALFLGSKRAAAAVMLFLAQGAIGMPVFFGPITGLARFLGPTGGYLWGYLIAAFVTGLIYEHSRAKGSSAAFRAMAIGNAIILLVGFSWLTTYMEVSKAFMLGVLPFIGTDLLKLMLATRLFGFLRARYPSIDLKTF